VAARASYGRPPTPAVKVLGMRVTPRAAER